jgi:hypothetical protein
MQKRWSMYQIFYGRWTLDALTLPIYLTSKTALDAKDLPFAIVKTKFISSYLLWHLLCLSACLGCCC